MSTFINLTTLRKMAKYAGIYSKVELTKMLDPVV